MKIKAIQEDARYLIVGLGNPGRLYRGNRHNVGFMLVDRLADRLGVSFSRMESKALVTKAEYQGYRILLAKPQTFMNLSGQAVSSLTRFYKIPFEGLIVTHDDVDIPLGTIRIRAKGGSGGQKGMQSIIDSLGTEEFPRLRIGIDHPPGRMEAAAYVLRDFSKQEAEILFEILERAADAALYFVTEGLDAAMNQFNALISEK